MPLFPMGPFPRCGKVQILEKALELSVFECVI